MKRNYILMAFCLMAVAGKSQFVTQSADGTGSIVLPLSGAALSFDIGKTEIAVGANNFSKALNTSNSRLFRNWFFGTNLSVKNSSGIGNLFQTGDIVPAGNLLGFLGFNLNNNDALYNAWKKSPVYVSRNIEQERRRALVEDYRTNLLNDLTVASLSILDSNLRANTLKDARDTVRKSTDGFALSRTVKFMLSQEINGLEAFITVFGRFAEQRQRQYAADLSQIDATKEINAGFDNFMKTHRVKRLTPFVFGGIEARNFSWYTGLASPLANSFIDTLYRGGLFGIGFNAQIGSVWFGVTYAYRDGDNFAGLSGKEYTLRTTDTSGNQALISEKKITGYSGRYTKVENNQLNLDFIKEFRLGDTSRFIANVYYRGAVASRDTAYLKNISNLGLGLYFLGNKAKFLGGLYVELPDVANNIEKAKPESERNFRPPFKKLTFGVMTKFSLSSVLGFTNRPRNPD